MLRLPLPLIGLLLFAVSIARSADEAAPKSEQAEPQPPFVSTVKEVAANAARHEKLPPIKIGANDWPWWRGPNLDGVAAKQDIPVSWTVPDPKAAEEADAKPAATENVVWQVTTPGRGHASPIVVGDRVFLAWADERAGTHSLVAYNTVRGKELWRREIHRGKLPTKVHRGNSHASATPACDGERIFTTFVIDGQLHVSAVSLDGKILWQTPAGQYDSIYGFGSSPALYGSLVIVAGDNDQTGAFLAALHRKTGEVVWRIKRPEIDTYGAPLVPRVAGRDQLLLGGGGWLTAFEPTTGKEIWKCLGPTTETTANTAVFSKDWVFCSGGYPKPYILIAVKADGTGDVTKTHLHWKSSAKVPYVPSPLYADDRLYIADDWGFASCFNAQTGKPIWAKRLGGDITSSPVKCGARIYIANEEGKVFVLAASDTYELLATNEMHETVMATPTICGGRMYLRTATKLYCIGFAKDVR